MNDIQSTEQQLDRTAQEYVLGELDAAAEQAFELQLAESQPAREAVEQAVLLTEATLGIPRAHAPSLSTEQGRVRPSSLRFSLAAAAIVAIGIATWLITRPDRRDLSSDRDAPIAAETPSPEDRLLASWIELGDDAWTEASVETTFGEEDDATESDDAPGWMTVAFSDED